MTLLVINEDPIAVKHVGWTISMNHSEVLLVEIIEATYRHPEALGVANVIQLEERVMNRMETSKAMSSAPHLLLLKNMQDVVSRLEEKFKL